MRTRAARPVQCDRQGCLPSSLPGGNPWSPMDALGQSCAGATSSVQILSLGIISCDEDHFPGPRDQNAAFLTSLEPPAWFAETCWSHGGVEPSGTVPPVDGSRIIARHPLGTRKHRERVREAQGLHLRWGVNPRMVRMAAASGLTDPARLRCRVAKCGSASPSPTPWQSPGRLRGAVAALGSRTGRARSTSTNRRLRKIPLPRRGKGVNVIH